MTDENSGSPEDAQTEQPAEEQKVEDQADKPADSKYLEVQNVVDDIFKVSVTY